MRVQDQSSSRIRSKVINGAQLLIVVESEGETNQGKPVTKCETELRSRKLSTNIISLCRNKKFAGWSLLRKKIDWNTLTADRKFT